MVVYSLISSGVRPPTTVAHSGAVSIGSFPLISWGGLRTRGRLVASASFALAAGGHGVPRVGGSRSGSHGDAGEHEPGKLDEPVRISTLSYQAMTLTWVRSTTVVIGASKIAECGSP